MMPYRLSTQLYCVPTSYVELSLIIMAVVTHWYLLVVGKRFLFNAEILGVDKYERQRLSVKERIGDMHG